MISKHRLFLKNQKGVTLLEVLTAMAIFMLVVIPLSTVYLNGITVYNKTQTQTHLRNELDYVLSIVMKKIQDASYYELSKDDSTQEIRNQILKVLKNENSGDLLDGEVDPEAFYTDITTYNIKVDSKAGETTSTVTKEIYNLLPDQPNTLYASSSYLVYGLFKLDKGTNGEANDPNNHKIIAYLLIAPKSKAKDSTYINDQRAFFNGLDEIEADDSFEYIRVVRTEISKNRLNQG